jgi:RNA polymerase sigma-70 factor (ECF subfamily)
MTREQFIDMVRSEQKGLRRFLLTLCGGDRMTADDIAQESLMKAYLALDKYDERQKARLWLMKIAYNTFLNHHAQTTRHRYEDMDTTAMISSQYSSDESFRYQELLQAMAQLPDSERTTLILHYFEGYKVEEIAHITNCTDAAVKKRLQRGREELKRRIKL